LVVDPAPSKPTAIGAFGIDYKGNTFMFGELRTKGTIPEICAEMRSHFKDFTFDRYLMDPNWDWDDHELGVNRMDLWRDEGMPFEAASDDKEYGMELVHKALATDPISEKPHFQVMNNCERTIWEFEHYRWMPKKPSDDLTYKPRTRDVDDDLVTTVRYFHAHASAWGALKPQRATRSRTRIQRHCLSGNPVLAVA
jgi:hypothetical protein